MLFILQRKLRNNSILAIFVNILMWYSVVFTASDILTWSFIIIEVLLLVRIYKINSKLEYDYGYFWGSK